MRGARRATGAARTLGASQSDHADVLGRRAEGLVREGHLAAAAADYRSSGELARKAGRPGVPASVDVGLGEIARLEGDLAEARRRLETALHATESSESGIFGAEGARAQVLTALGRLAEAEGEIAEARLRHHEALAAARRSPLTTDLADAAEGQAGAALLTGAGQRAALLLGVAVALRGMAVAGDPDVARIALGARDLVGPEAFASAFARGAAMRRQEALTVFDGEDA